MPDFLKKIFRKDTVFMSEFQIHACVMSLFASLLINFGKKFVLGLKKAEYIKVFIYSHYLFIIL